MELRAWQIDCYKTLQEHNFNGVIKVASGKGKTVIAIKIISDVLEKTKGKALVVVPTINLMVQWKREIQNFAPHLKTSYFYGKKRDQSGDVVLSVINTASKLEFTNNFDIKVLDEIHHYGADLYASIFSLKTLHTIGLSATPERENDGDLAIRYGAGDIVYALDNLEDLKGRFTLFSIRTPLSMEEYQNYMELQSEYKRLLAITGYDPGQIAFKGKRGDKYALRILKVWSDQAKIRHNAQSKVDIIKAILNNEQGQKVIIFSESIAFAETIADKLGAIAVHSKMSKDEVLDRLKKFRNAESAVLIAPRLIDEGYDVPDANVAIVASFTRSSRQMIQRDGRILRTKDYIRRYTLVIDGVEEDKYFSIIKRTNMTDLAKQGVWLRYNQGFVDDHELKEHFLDWLENEGDGYEEFLTKKLDLARMTKHMDEEFYSKHKSAIERLNTEQPGRWPMLEPTKRHSEFLLHNDFDEDKRRQLKEDVRKAHQRIILPDEFFNALMRIIDGEQFALDSDAKHYFRELAKENSLNFSKEVFSIIKAVAKHL